ncbi:MAG: TetR family transcriptional regulator C-terminal domain-containing protein [Coriobacteriales bacterium]|jgi:AcrR family transcriptional regulator|nr:TetR family transcriptional regulator C-terminal domain-containing protein [Coriobacteriales bacterium]
MPKQKSDRRVTYTRTALRDALIELMHNQHISGITVKSICERADVNRSTFYLHYHDQYDLLHQVEHEVLEALKARLQGSRGEQEGDAGQSALDGAQTAPGAEGMPGAENKSSPYAARRARGRRGGREVRSGREARDARSGRDAHNAHEARDARSTHDGPVSITAMTEILEYARENAGVARVLLSENCDFAFQKDIMSLAQVVAPWMSPSYGERTQEYVLAFSITGCISIAEKWLQDGMIEEPEEIARLILQVLYNGTSSFEK